MIESAFINVDNEGKVNPFPHEMPTCSFSGKPAEFYIGLSGEREDDEVRVLGAISAGFVETAILNVFGQGVDDIRWPVILDLKGKICYHSFHAHIEGFSAVMGWKALLARKNSGTNNNG